VSRASRPPTEDGPERGPRSGLARVVRALRHAIFDESRGGRAGEIAAWSNAASAVTIGAAIAALGWNRLPFHAAWAGVTGAVLMLVVLRLALTHRSTVWFAAVLGTLTVAAGGGAFAWLFGHVLELSAAPSIAAVAGAVVAALAPAWSYASIARQRAGDVRDSLVEPISAPRSR
jgi:hypothetical protein